MLKLLRSRLLNQVNKLQYFTAKWCGPCRFFKPHILELQEEGYDIEIHDIDESPEKSSEYQVMSVPTLVFERDSKVYARTSGVIPKSEVAKALDWDPDL